MRVLTTLLVIVSSIMASHKRSKWGKFWFLFKNKTLDVRKIQTFQVKLFAIHLFPLDVKCQIIFTRMLIVMQMEFQIMPVYRHQNQIDGQFFHQRGVPELGVLVIVYLQIVQLHFEVSKNANACLFFLFFASSYTLIPKHFNQA